jgi:hypothetical protein
MKFTKDKLIALWKDTAFLLWALPVSASFAALAFDYGFLLYFDIPMEYVEINLYTAFLGASILVGLIIVCYLMMEVAGAMGESESLLFNLLSSPEGAVFAALVVLLSVLSDMPLVVALYVYGFFLISQLIDAISLRKTNTSFQYRVKKLIQASRSKKSEKRTGSRSEAIYDFVGYIVIILLVLMIIAACGNLAAKQSTKWVLASDPTAIIIKRNNNVFLEKRFDIQTHVLDSGLVVRGLDEGILNLRPVRHLDRLISEAEYQSKMAEKAKKMTPK